MFVNTWHVRRMCASVSDASGNAEAEWSHDTVPLS